MTQAYTTVKKSTMRQVKTEDRKMVKGRKQGMILREDYEKKKN